MDEEQKRTEEPKHTLLEMREEEKKPFLSPKVKKELREWAVSIAVALVAVLLIRTFLFTVIMVKGPSMQDTLYTGDRLIVTIPEVKFGGGPERFDVVICHYPDSRENYVKRVIGLPGETIEARDGVTYINGEPIDEPFLMEGNTVRYHRTSFGPVEIPEDCYFVMGDNRDNSNDSRAVGCIAKSQLVGHVRVVMWPFDHAGAVEGSETYGQ